MYGLAILLIIFIVPAAIIIKNVPLRERPYKVLLEGTIAAALGIIFVFMIASITGISLGERLGELTDQAIQILISNESFMNNSAIAEMSAEEVRKALSLFYAMMINSLPGILLMFTIIVSYIEYRLIARIMARKNDNVRFLPEFKNFSLPKSALWGWLIVFFASWLISQGTHIGAVVLANVGLLMEFSFVLQGIAVLLYYFDSRRLPKPIAVILIILFISTRITQTFIFMLGVGDLVFNLRGRMARKSI